MNSKTDLKKELAAAAKVQESAERSIRIAAIVAQALREIEQEPILVGGAAVEFYTQGGYNTEDIDMLAAGGPELVAAMESLGFQRMGKDFVDEKNKIYIEFPGSSLGPQEKSVQIKIDGRDLRIVSIEDLIVDRLCAFKYWQSAIDGLNVLKLLEAGEINTKRLSERARDEKAEDALYLLQDLYEDIIRKKIPSDQANVLLAKGMRSLKS